MLNYRMKINEKTLVSYCVSNTPCDREGWLVKRGEVNKAFQRRWCVLRGNLLFYSERQGDREPLGVIILEGCTVELAEEETEVYAFKVGRVEMYIVKLLLFRLSSMGMESLVGEFTLLVPRPWRIWRPG